MTVTVDKLCVTLTFHKLAPCLVDVVTSALEVEPTVNTSSVRFCYRTT